MNSFAPSGARMYRALGWQVVFALLSAGALSREAAGGRDLGDVPPLVRTAGDDESTSDPAPEPGPGTECDGDSGSVSPADDADSGHATTTSHESAADTPPTSYYVEPRSYGTRRETEPPRYIRPLSETGVSAFEEFDWLDFGADYRVRYEYRDDDLRRLIAGRDEPFLLRARTYAGIKEVWDPIRFAIEIEDARRANSRFPEDDRDINENEIIQAFGELHFANALGEGRPFRFQAGRLAMEYLDRRLIARNEWRNTTNNFRNSLPN